MDKNVVAVPTPWPDIAAGGLYTLRRGALSAFGFGGTNAHAIFERFSDPSRYIANKKLSNGYNIQKHPRIQRPEIELSIIGMDCIFGDAKSVEEFEQAIYWKRSIQRGIPTKRWRFLTQDSDFKKAVLDE